MLGLLGNYNETGYITLNIYCKNIIYTDRINFNYKYDSIDSWDGTGTPTSRKKIVNTFSNGTNICILKLNTLENERLISSSSVNNDFKITEKVIEEIETVIDIPRTINLDSRSYYTYDLGSKVKPVKYLVDYETDGLAGTLPVNSSKYRAADITNFK